MTCMANPGLIVWHPWSRSTESRHDSTILGAGAAVGNRCKEIGSSVCDRSEKANPTKQDHRSQLLDMAGVYVYEPPRRLKDLIELSVSLNSSLGVDASEEESPEAEEKRRKGVCAVVELALAKSLSTAGPTTLPLSCRSWRRPVTNGRSATTALYCVASIASRHTESGSASMLLKPRQSTRWK